MSNDVTLQSLGSGSSSPRVIVESSNSSSKRKSLNNGTIIKNIKQKGYFFRIQPHPLHQHLSVGMYRELADDNG